MISLQACWRGYLARSYLEEQSLAALRIQSFWRMYLARREYHRIRERVILLQSHARGYLARRRFVTLVNCILAVNNCNHSLADNVLLVPLRVFLFLPFVFTSFKDLVPFLLNGAG